LWIVAAMHGRRSPRPDGPQFSEAGNNPTFLKGSFVPFHAPPLLAIVLVMADITIRRKKQRAERILKALGGLRFDEPTAEGDAVQEFCKRHRQNCLQPMHGLSAKPLERRHRVS
jgi:hypothetical protein